MHFLLIHGSWHGAWCWHKIVPRLQAEGHSAHAIDLPGRGRSPARSQLVSLKSMVGAALAAMPEDQTTTIVVHSRYGVLASQLAELAPERIARTIYLASFMLPNGKAVADYFREDRDSQLPPFVDINRLGLWDWLRPEAYRHVLYHDCHDEDNALAASLLCREPLRPAIGKLQLTDDRYGRVPRGYIRLSEDRAVSPFLQDRLLNETSCDRVETVQAGHSAYFSKPDQLTAAICRIAGR